MVQRFTLVEILESGVATGPREFICWLIAGKGALDFISVSCCFAM